MDAKIKKMYAVYCINFDDQSWKSTPSINKRAAIFIDTYMFFPWTFRPWLFTYKKLWANENQAAAEYDDKKAKVKQ